MTPGVNSGVRIRLESDEYKIWFEGYGDIGRNENNISGRAHFGKYISKRDVQVFGEVGVTLDDVALGFFRRLCVAVTEKRQSVICDVVRWEKMSIAWNRI